MASDTEIIKCIIWMEGRVEELVNQGLIQVPVDITDVGRKLFKEIEPSYRPNRELLLQNLIVKGCPEEMADHLCHLILQNESN